MNGVAFTFALLFGLDAVEVEEAVMRTCVERTVPRKVWREDVVAEIKRQKAPNPDLALTDYLCGPWYDAEVNEPIRGRLGFFWEFEERLWLATSGHLGQQPAAAQRVNLHCLVLDAGKALPAAVTAGVPVVPWREKIGRPK